LLRSPLPPPDDASAGGQASAADQANAQDDRVEALARQYVKRWGVVFRDLLRREPQAPPWRDLVRVYRRLEMRGELRGGRLVGGFVGEQFATPEAVESLRAIRRGPRNGEVLALSACDPLNLVGLITPGARIPATLANTVVYKDGAPTDDTGHEAPVAAEINPYPMPPRPSLSAG
jgi:ATP-dependent Lhr-like helicase